MNGKLLYVLLAVFVPFSLFAVTEHHGLEPKVFSERYHNFNNCEIPITNYGEFGYMYGFWPTGSREPYIFGAGIWIGAIKNGDPLVSCGYNTSGHGGDWMPGPPEHNYDHSVDPLSHPEDRIYLSTDSVDLTEWPLEDSMGFPIILSEQDGWGEYNDLWEPNHAWEPRTYPLGLRVRQHSFCWKSPEMLEDMLFILYQIENVSGETLSGMYAGIGADMDVGWADDDLVGYDIDHSIGYTYTINYEPSWTSPPPYYVGITVLRGPRAADTVYVRDYPWYPNYPQVIRDTVLPDSHLVLTSLMQIYRGGGPRTDEERYLCLKGCIPSGEYSPWPKKEQIPDDQRMILGCGPFELEPSEIDTFLIALAFSNGSTGGLDNLLYQAELGRSVARTVGGNPLIRVASPNGGEEVSGTTSINWETVGEEINKVDLYLSSDSGRRWGDLAIGLRNTGSYLWNSRIVADGTYLLKICGRDSLQFTWDLSDGEFVVNNLHRESLPLHTFPNPFSRSATIRYYVPHQGEVSLTIYDAAGRSVARPIHGVRTSGMGAVVWDGTDSSGRKVSSGTYFLRLEVGDYSATRKLCVVR